MSWHYSGFHVHIGERIRPDDEPRHWRGFSQERMVYIPVEKSKDGVTKVIYTSKDGRTRKTLDSLDWLAISQLMYRAGTSKR